MHRVGAFQNARAHQEIMDQSVDRYQGSANLAPSWIVRVSDNQKVRQNHAENFIGKPVNA